MSLTKSKTLSLPSVLTAPFLLFAIALLAISTPVKAQSGGLPDVLEDIFSGGSSKQGVPFGGLSDVYIENIPLVVSFDARADLLPPEATLIVTAIAPPPPNVRRANPLVIGETHLLISRLAPPLNMVVAVPSDMARELDYAQIEARIIDANGNTAYELRDTIQYTGGQAPFLDLVPVSATNGAPTNKLPEWTPPSQTQPGIPTNGYSGANIATISGDVRLNGNSNLMRGAHLIVRVTENELAGGFNANVLSEERISLDQKTAPFTFEILAPTGVDGRLDAPEIEAWVEDWAGRKTHIMHAPTGFTPITRHDGHGTTANVTLYLDAMISGSEAVESGQPYTPPPAVMRTISGTAGISAPRGLPSGSTLIVTVVDANDLSAEIEQVRVPLDGLSGDVPFSLSVEGSKLARYRETPLLNGRIDDRTGKTLLRSRTLATLPNNGEVTLDLQPTEVY